MPGSDDWVPMQPPDEEGDPWDSDWVPVPKPSGNLEKNFVGSELVFLQNYDYPRPSEFNETSTQDLEQIHTNLNENIRLLNGRIVGRKRPLYCPVSSFHIDEMRIYVTDSLGRPVNFNGIDWFMTLILHSM